MKIMFIFLPFPKILLNVAATLKTNCSKSQKLLSHKILKDAPTLKTKILKVETNPLDIKYYISFVFVK